MAIVFFLFMVSKYENTEVLLARIHFDMTGTTLTRESEAVLKRIANKMRAEPNIMIDVNGYTDNVGSSSANIVLSKKMAERVKSYVATKIDETGSRIQTTGFGANNPIASNATEQGRARNRRVEIVIRQPDAVLTSFDNDVRVQPPALRPGWLVPTPNYYLYRGYKVTTGKKSSARIVYPNKGVLRMGDEAMVIVHSLNPQQKEKPLLENIQLQNGGLTDILRDLPGQTGSPASTTTVHEVPAQINDTLVTEKLEDLVVVYQRNAEVADMGEQFVEEKDEGIAADMEGAPDEYLRPPAAPRLVSPRMHETKYSTDEIAFVWQPSGVFSHLQVAEDSLFKQIAFDAYASSDSVITSLTENLYYWRVSGIDGDSLEGEYSDYWTFVVEIDTIEPELQIEISRGARDNQFVAAGHTDTDATLYINDERVKQAENGSFSYTIPKDYRGAFVVARAVDGAGNVKEISSRIPGVPVFALGVNAGLCTVASDRGDEAEKGFWYGIQFSRMLWPGVSFFVSTTIARSNGKMGDALNATDIMPIEIGLRQSFKMGRVSPFLYIRSGFAWSKMSTARRILPGAMPDGTGITVDPTMSFGAGCWLYVGGNWFLNLHADYTHFFSEGQYPGNAKALTRIGFGIQDRM